MYNIVPLKLLGLLRFGLLIYELNPMKSERSYGSMGKMGKQIFYYLTLGGCGLWTLYRLFTLNKAIKTFNRKLAINCGLGAQDILKLGLI